MIKNNISELIKRGSTTAKSGFSNERDVIYKFNNWKIDEDARLWLKLMHYKLEEIEKVAAVKVAGSHKADIQVKIKIYMKDVVAAENISIKLVSNPTGFNQIDKRKIEKYVELWAIPEDIAKSLRLFTGESPPIRQGTRDHRRMFLNEMEPSEQQRIIDFFESNKIMIISDVLKGRDKLAASWMLIYLKGKKTWALLSISIVMNYYGDGPVQITSQGSLRIGKIGMQRKGGDQGRDTAKMLQFKINPADIVSAQS